MKKIEKLIENEFSHFCFDPYRLILEKNHRIPLVGWICKGTLNLLATDQEGQTSRRGLMGRGDFFGLEFFFDQGLSLYDALSLEPLECYVIEPEDLVQLVAREPEFGRYLETMLILTMKRFFRSPVLSGGAKREEARRVKITRFDKAIAYIDSHYMNPLTLDDIARQVGLSRYYFSRMFKQGTGHSFKDYLNITRLEASKKLLALPDMNISQACYSVGFNDVSYFARIFKRYEGMSPSDYRRQVLAES